jgi:oxygen-independent coproporphyrinogen-3 oxidase
MAGIYIHIPFCKQACHYCNFHFSTSLKYKRELVDALCKEIVIQKDFLNTKTLESIYFGGGTPSLLDEEDLDKIFSSLQQHFSFAPTIETTLEANPDDLNKNKLKILADSPVNRLSIGVQSFFEEDLRYFNRAHNSKEATNSILDAQDTGFQNLTVDLIYGSPTSTSEMIAKNVQFLIENNIGHISTYALTVEEKTALFHFIKKGSSKPIDENQATEQYKLIMSLLKSEEFLHYEISNFGKEGQLAIHNTNYWNNVPYLGIGPSAHSYDGHGRQWNVANNQKYLKSINANRIPFEKEILTNEEKFNEYIMTSLRTMWGCNEKTLKGFGHKAIAHFQASIKTVKSDWIIKSNNSWILTDEGKHYADGIASDLFL